MTDPFDELAELAEKITPGEWRNPYGGAVNSKVAAVGKLYLDHGYGEANAEFIVLVRNLLPRILAQREALRRMVGASKALGDNIGEFGTITDGEFLDALWDAERTARDALEGANNER